jgi:uncharacterized repeat protein (TIGR03803 family)
MDSAKPARLPSGSTYRLSIWVLAAAVSGCNGYAGERAMPASFLAAQVSEAAHGNGLQAVYTFPANGKNGAQTRAPLISSGGILYGAALDGGVCCGTVFSFDPASRALNVLHRFADQGNSGPLGITVTKGVIYGAASGSLPSFHAWGGIFSIEIASRLTKTLYTFKGGRDGMSPGAAPIIVGGTLYGTTQYGGNTNSRCQTGGCGTIYAFDIASGRERILYRFRGAPDGATPNSALLLRGGALYGITLTGGTGACGNGCGYGTVFSYTIATGKTKVLYRFLGASDGGAPYGALVTLDGLLYGTTPIGGRVNGLCPSGCGTLFAVNPVTGRARVVYRFRGGSDGGQPAGLAVVNGGIYGTTFGGENTAQTAPGTLYSFDQRAGVETVLHRFNWAARRFGLTPAAPPVALNGQLYGATLSGGANGACDSLGGSGCGVIFAAKP